jgi:hypothetical protein
MVTRTNDAEEILFDVRLNDRAVIKARYDAPPETMSKRNISGTR